MRANPVWCMGAALVLAACGGADRSDDAGVAGDPPQISILDVSVRAGGAATLEYAFADDGPVRVQIDWGDGSALQGFTGEGGTFTSRHVYDAVVTSVVISVITTDADGNTSAATRTVDLLGRTVSDPDDTEPDATTTTASVAPTTPDTAAAATTVTATTTTTASPRPTRPAPTTTTTTTTTATTTTTSTTTTTMPPRRYRVVVRGDRITVRGDCDSVGGRGDFIIKGLVDTSGSAEERFNFGSRSNTVQLDVGDSLNISTIESVSTPAEENVTTEWSAGFGVSEVDATGNDPDMDARERFTDGVISTARSPISQTLTVGSGDCQVDMSFTVTAEFVS